MDQQTREMLDGLGRRIATLAPKPAPEPEPEPAADPNAPWRDYSPLEKLQLGLTTGGK